MLEFRLVDRITKIMGDDGAAHGNAQAFTDSLNKSQREYLMLIIERATGRPEPPMPTVATKATHIKWSDAKA
jgi:hypothetical protein